MKSCQFFPYVPIPPPPSPLLPQLPLEALSHSSVLFILGAWLYALTETYACLWYFNTKKTHRISSNNKKWNRLWCCINRHTNHATAYAMIAFWHGFLFIKSFQCISFSFIRKLHAQECTQEYNMEFNASN